MGRITPETLAIQTIKPLIWIGTTYFPGYRRRIVWENLWRARHSLGLRTEDDVRKVMEDFYLFFSRLLAEISVLTFARASWIQDQCQLDLPPEVRNLLHPSMERAVIILVPHMGNWEMAGLYLAMQPYFPRICAVYKPLHVRWVDRWIHRMRARWGTELVPMGNVLRHLARHHRDPYAYVLIADQNPVHLNACYWITFLGRRVPVYWGPEKMARRWNLPLLFAWADPVSLSDVSAGYTIRFRLLAQEPARHPEGELTLRFIRFLEHIIRGKPWAWLWTHRRWKHSLRAHQYLHNWLNDDAEDSTALPAAGR